MIDFTGAVIIKPLKDPSHFIASLGKYVSYEFSRCNPVDMAKSCSDRANELLKLEQTASPTAICKIMIMDLRESKHKRTLKEVCDDLRSLLLAGKVA